MPPKVKIGLSLIVALVAAGAFLYFADIARRECQFAVLFLGPFMIVSMWIFPEVSRKDASASQGREKQPVAG